MSAIVLGIDPGSVIGCAVFEDRRLLTVYSEDISKAIKGDAVKRACLTGAWVSAQLRRWSPHAVVVEDCFFCRNINTLKSLSIGLGAVIAVSHEAGARVKVMPASSVRKACGVKSGADDAALSDCEFDDTKRLGQIICSTMNTGPDDIARAVKCALVEHCKYATPEGHDDKEHNETFCRRTSEVCEMSFEERQQGKSVDPCECHLVRRVLDALGISNRQKSGGSK